MSELYRKRFTLGRLTYGKELWTKVVPADVLALEAANGTDALTDMFDNELSKGSNIFLILGCCSVLNCQPFPGNITEEDCKRTFLNEEVYSQGITVPDVPPQKRPRRFPKYYRIGDDAAYSIVSDFPSNSAPDAEQYVL